MTDPSAPPVDLDVLLRERIAAHAPGSTIDDRGVVSLGGSGIRIASQVGDVAPFGSQYSASLYFEVSGGPFGGIASFASISGYERTPAAAVVEGSCLWVCSLLDVLAAAGLGRFEDRPTEPSLISTAEVTVHGRPFRLVSTRIDRTFGESGDAPARLHSARSVVGGDGGLASAVVAHGSLPVLAGGDAVLLSCFLGRYPTGVTAEVKVYGSDWAPSISAFDHVAPDAHGVMTLLRDLAVLVPLRPARLERASLRTTLDSLASYRSAETAAAGWGGWRAHAGRLAAPMAIEEIAQVIDPYRLPPDYVEYLAAVSGGGAGPGYGLLPPAIVDGELELAHAGCGVRWVLRPDGVWCDATASDGTLSRTDPTFTEWYGRWLAQAYAGRPFTDWDHLCCANINVLAQVLEKGQPEPDSLAVTLTVPPGRPAVPCQGCVSTYARFGQSEVTAFGGA